MNNLNSVLIEGNLTEDLVLDKTAKGSPVCNFTIVSTRCYKGETGIEKEENCFYVQVFGKLAEEAVNLGRKDCCVRVVGRLRQECRTGPDGQPQSKTIVIAEHAEFKPEPAKGW
jgi:single-strand DNA-binding protein